MTKPVTCFLIDDDEDDQEIFAMALNKVDASIDCVFADTGSGALQLIQQDNTFAPQYIFLDLNMPGMTGKQCLTALRQIDRLRQTPIIIYSTSAEVRDILETKKLGATDFITKPERVSTLTDRLTTLFLTHQSACCDAL